MRSALPFIAVLLALIAAASIAYIAWELSSGKHEEQDDADDDDAKTPLDE